MENYNKKMEDNLIKLLKEKQETEKRLLNSEIVIGLLATFIFLLGLSIASFIETAVWIRVLIYIVSFIILLVGCAFALRIEQIAGYYLCANCKHRHIPKYSSVFFAPHLGRTRYMKCPNCNKKSWQKKVLSEDTFDAEI